MMCQKLRFAIFNSSGTLLDDIKNDEKEFGITARHLIGEGVMGFEVFEVSGPHPNLDIWADFYNLEPEGSNE